MVEKTAEELLQEAEQFQKELAPELYGEEGDAGTSDTEISEKEKALDTAPDKEKASEESEKKEEAEKKEEEKVAEVPSAEQLQAEIASLKSQLNQWELRDNSAAGRLKAVSEEVKVLKAEIATLKSENENLKAGTVKHDVNDVRLQEIKDKFGDDFADMEYIAEKIAEKKVAAIEKASIKETVKETVDTGPDIVAGAAYLEELSGFAPNWKAIAKDQRFKDWLSGPDPLSGRIRWDMALEADSNKDAFRVSRFYNTFDKEASAPKTPTLQPVKKSREDRIAPGGSARGGDNDAPMVETYTPDEVKKMKDDIYALKYSGDDAKVKKAEMIQKKLDAYLQSLSG